MKLLSIILAAAVAYAAKSCDNKTNPPAPSSLSPTMTPAPTTYTPAPTAGPTVAPTKAPTSAPQPGNGSPILINLAVPDHVGVDCPGIKSRHPAGTLFCGSPKPPGANIYEPSCDKSMTITYKGKSVTCVISFQATGVGLTTGAYVEIVPEAYKVLTGETYGGQLHGGTCTGVCNVARS